MRKITKYRIIKQTLRLDFGLHVHKIIRKVCLLMETSGNKGV